MRQVFISVAARIAFVLWVLIWIEAGLQVLYYVTAHQTLFTRTAIPIFTPNEYCGFFNKPDLSYVHRTNEFTCRIYTNTEGFRVPRPGVEYLRTKPPGTFRILLLGPSFAFGWGVNYGDTAGAKLEELLKPYFKGKSTIEVINAGVPSLAPLPQLNWFEHVGCLFKSDLVIQFIYGSMIVDPDGDKGLFADPQGYLENSDLRGEQRFFEVAKRSALVFYGWMLYARLFASTGAEIAGAGRHLEQARPFSPDTPEAKLSLAYYRRLARAALKCGSHLSIVYFPLSYCVHRGDLARWRHLGINENIDEQIALDRDFCGYLRDKGFDCLNITPDLVKAAADSPERLYYWLDIHWTPRGNLVAARSIAPHLADEFSDRQGQGFDGVPTAK